MKRCASAIAMVQLLASLAMGGTVMFDPAVIELDPAALPAEVSFLISVTPESFPFGPNGEQVFDNVTLIFNMGSLAYGDVRLSEQFIADTIFNSDGVGICELVPCPTGGFADHPLIAPYSIGILTAAVPGQLPPGEYSIIVDSTWDGGASSIGVGLQSEGLFGGGIVRVVLEPGTLIMFGAVLAAIRLRSRRAVR